MDECLLCQGSLTERTTPRAQQVGPFGGWRAGRSGATVRLTASCGSSGKEAVVRRRGRTGRSNASSAFRRHFRESRREPCHKLRGQLHRAQRQPDPGRKRDSRASRSRGLKGRGGHRRRAEALVVRRIIRRQKAVIAIGLIGAAAGSLLVAAGSAAGALLVVVGVVLAFVPVLIQPPDGGEGSGTPPGTYGDGGAGSF